MNAQFPFDDLYARLRRGEELDFTALREHYPDQASKINRLRLLASELGPTHSANEVERPRKGSPVTTTILLDDPPGLRFFRAAEREVAAPQPGLEPGRVLDKFKLVRRIGAGGMGEVWEAQQISLGGRRVALKFIRPDRVGKNALGMFAREARAGARLQHPGIVAIHESGETDGFAWIAMDFVEGGWTLRDFIVETAGETELPANYDTHVAEFVALIADALQAAHDAVVIHRDLKPQNILIDVADRPRIADFGLAKILDETQLSQTGDFAGTAHYMSPEQVTARRMGLDSRTDVFSLGVILYEMLALRRPFNGDTPQQVAAQIVTKEPADPRTIRSRVPVDLAVIAGKALEKDPDRRFQTMAEFAADLRRFLAHEPILARAPTPWNRSLKWVRRHPTVTSVGGILIVAFLVVSWMFVQLTRSNSNLIAKSREVETEKESAKQSARLATQRVKEVFSLSAIQELRDLEEDADRLWPADTNHVGSYESWLERARVLIEGSPEEGPGRPRRPSLQDHEAKLDELRQRAVATSSEPVFSGTQPVDSRVSAMSRHTTYTFDDPQDRWWYFQLEKLVDDLRMFGDEKSGGLYSIGTSAEHGWGIKRRLEFARSIGSRTLSGSEAKHAWSAALDGISRDPRYAGLSLEPQLGLLPIGEDPESHLLEFAHLQTGNPPLHRDAKGRIVPDEDMGLVFVLVPGGSFHMGAQALDKNARNYDPQATDDGGDVQEKTLRPFFFSKYEMTQGQWTRITGQAPSDYSALNYLTEWNSAAKQWTSTHPVENVSWDDCVHVLGRLGLALPSEEEWEFGARGGTNSPWWTGADPGLLAGAANLADAYLRKEERDFNWLKEWESLDDHNAAHAEIGCYRANPFGMHDVIGNVSEWCLDVYTGPKSDPTAPGESAFNSRTYRGGSFLDLAEAARVTIRNHNKSGFKHATLGVRPVLEIAPRTESGHR